MKSASFFFAAFVSLVLSVFVTAAPAGAQSEPTNAPAIPAPAKSLESLNADLVKARAANQEKRYADAEILMLTVTSAKPELIYPWLELGMAQVGLK